MAYVTRIDKWSSKDIGKINVNWKSPIKKTLIISGIIAIFYLLWFIVAIIVSIFDANTSIGVVLLYSIAAIVGFVLLMQILFLPFVWGYYNNKPVYKYNLWFSLIFLGLIILSAIPLAIFL